MTRRSLFALIFGALCSPFRKPAFRFRPKPGQYCVAIYRPNEQALSLRLELIAVLDHKIEQNDVEALMAVRKYCKREVRDGPR